MKSHLLTHRGTRINDTWIQTLPNGDLEIVEAVPKSSSCNKDGYIDNPGGPIDEQFCQIPKSQIPALIEFLKEVA